MVAPEPLTRRRWPRPRAAVRAAICAGSPLDPPPSAPGRRWIHRHLRRVATPFTAICDGSAEEEGSGVGGGELAAGAVDLASAGVAHGGRHALGLQPAYELALVGRAGRGPLRTGR